MRGAKAGANNCLTLWVGMCADAWQCVSLTRSIELFAASCASGTSAASGLLVPQVVQLVLFASAQFDIDSAVSCSGLTLPDL